VQEIWRSSLPHAFHGDDLAQFGIEILIVGDDVVPAVAPVSRTVIDPEAHNCSTDHLFDGDAQALVSGFILGGRQPGGSGLTRSHRLFQYVSIFPGPSPFAREPTIKPFHM